MIRVAVVDDHPHVAIALRALLDKTADIRLVAGSRHGNEVAALVRQARPDVLLLDVFIEPEGVCLGAADAWGRPAGLGRTDGLGKVQCSALANGELR